MLLPSALGFSPHPPVSVYGTGAAKAIAAFLDGVDSKTSLLKVRSSSRLPIIERICLLDLSSRLTRYYHSRDLLSFRVPAVLSCSGTGISTCCPSTTTLVLALGPDLPRADQLYSGTLGYSAERILTFLSLLIPAFSLPGTPLLLPVQLRRDGNAPLPIVTNSAASVSCLSPVHFRRRTSRPVSYYALFE